MRRNGRLFAFVVERFGLARSAVSGAACLWMVFAAVAARAEEKWFSVDSAGSNRYWDVAAGWKPTAALPTEVDAVDLNSSATPPDNPLVITNGVKAIAKSIRLATLADPSYATDGRIPSLHISGGLLTSATNWWDSIAVGHHANGYGLLTLSGGLLSNACMAVGYNGIGVVTNAGGTVDLDATGLLLGQNASGRGTYVQQGGAFVGGATVGNSGTGVLIHAGGTLVARGYFYVGRAAGSEGLLDVRAPGVNVGAGQTLFIGYSGRGVLEQRADLSADYLKIGGSTNVTSVATIYAGVTNTVKNSCNVGGYVIPVTGGGTEDKTGNGVLALRGGVLHIVETGLSERLFVGRQAESRGRIQGWGRISHPTSGTTNIRLVLGEGVVQADGEGEARTLDLNEIVSTSNNVPNGATGTNGWYAVNKGRVFFPRTWFSNSPSSPARCLGDWHSNTTPGLVNSVHAAFTGVLESANYWRGGVYAPDRDDIPEGLPADAAPVGIWQLGLYKDLTSWTANQAAPFSTVTLTFRYDQTRVKSYQRPVLYRHTASGWSRVETVASSENCVTTATPLARLVGADANIGWFALVTRDGGTLISVY